MKQNLLQFCLQVLHYDITLSVLAIFASKSSSYSYTHHHPYFHCISVSQLVTDIAVFARLQRLNIITSIVTMVSGENGCIDVCVSVSLIRDNDLGVKVCILLEQKCFI